MMAAGAVSAMAARSGAAMCPVTRDLPEETAVALVYDGTTQAVMMATPADLEDFAVGFSLTEGIIAATSEIETMEVVPQPEGIEVRMWLSGERSASLRDRRRMMAGPIGCGLCGIDSLAEALRPLPMVGSGATLCRSDIQAAVGGLAGLQPLHDRTHAVHAAGLFVPGSGMVAAREDVGRHNALDKLVGTVARTGLSSRNGAVVLTSRVSVDMVQKTAIAGASFLVAVSAPTLHAVRLAETAGITLVALARGTEFEVFTHPHRVTGSGHCHVV